MKNVHANIDELRALLEQFDLFEDLPARERDVLAEVLTLREFEAGEGLFHESDPAHGFYLIVQGEVKICRFGADGREQILHILTAGQPCGEAPAFEGAHYPASAITIGKMRALYVSREEFRELGRREPDLLLSMLAILSKRLRHFVNMVAELSLSEVSARLARHLLELSEKQENESEARLDSTKAMLANRLGTIAETLSRTLARMQRKGLIEVEGKTIRILDADGLRDVAEGGKV